MKRIAIITLLISLIFSGFSQVVQRKTYSLSDLVANFDQGTGQVYITSDERFPSILKGYINYLAKRPIKGWRVQIYFGIGHKARIQAEQIKNTFLENYPGYPVYIVFEQPYFKVRVGNFYSKRDAAKFLFIIKSQFPKAFLTEDNIDIQRLTD